jgi:hypothetical protein
MPRVALIWRKPMQAVAQTDFVARHADQAADMGA